MFLTAARPRDVRTLMNNLISTSKLYLVHMF